MTHASVNILLLLFPVRVPFDLVAYIAPFVPPYCGKCRKFHTFDPRLDIPLREGNWNGSVKLKKLLGSSDRIPVLAELEHKGLSGCVVQKIPSSDSMAELCNSLAFNCRLSLLDLSYNNLTSDDASVLASALIRNTALQVLNLSFNKIGAEGAFALSTALIKNSSLKVLSLSSNRVGNEGATSLATALFTNRTLQVLHLGLNKVGYDGVNALAMALKWNTSLKILSLSSNKIEPMGVYSLASQLEFNNTLEKMVYSDKDQIAEINTTPSETMQDLERSESTPISSPPPLIFTPQSLTTIKKPAISMLSSSLRSSNTTSPSKFRSESRTADQVQVGENLTRSSENLERTSTLPPRLPGVSHSLQTRIKIHLAKASDPINIPSPDDFDDPIINAVQPAIGILNISGRSPNTVIPQIRKSPVGVKMSRTDNFLLHQLKSTEVIDVSKSTGATLTESHAEKVAEAKVVNEPLKIDIRQITQPAKLKYRKKPKSILKNTNTITKTTEPNKNLTTLDAAIPINSRDQDIYSNCKLTKGGFPTDESFYSSPSSITAYGSSGSSTSSSSLSSTSPEDYRHLQFITMRDKLGITVFPRPPPTSILQTSLLRNSREPTSGNFSRPYRYDFIRGAEVQAAGAPLKSALSKGNLKKYDDVVGRKNEAAPQVQQPKQSRDKKISKKISFSSQTTWEFIANDMRRTVGQDDDTDSNSSNEPSFAELNKSAAQTVTISETNARLLPQPSLASFLVQTWKSTSEAMWSVNKTMMDMFACCAGVGDYSNIEDLEEQTPPLAAPSIQSQFRSYGSIASVEIGREQQNSGLDRSHRQFLRNAGRSAK
ncbi:hypothetical protein HK098_000161 [Nowakowskiella sp. JEL0407]|nr:hypothetical protein HK098_000161 [Nowakowskiella sp. JEL0407]